MLKRILVILAFFALVSSALAEVKLVSPIEKYSTENQVIELGSVQAGETINLIFSNYSGNQNPWVKSSASSIPEGWTAKELTQARNKSTLILQVFVPKKSATGAFQFKTVLEDSKGYSENAGFLVFVEEGLISSRVDALKKTVNSGDDLSFIYSVDNDSIAEHAIEISSSLPLTWFKPVTVVLKPKSSQQVILEISPKNYGEKKFSLYTNSMLNGKLLNEIRPRIEVKPTLKSKYNAAMYGFPFFTPSLVPYYIFNSLISQLS